MRTPKPHSMILFAVVAICMAVAASCVTPQDIRNLRMSVEDVRDGAITVPEFNQRVDAVAVAAEERGEALREELQGIPTDPVSLLVYLAGAVGTVTTAVKGTNLVRDGRRRKRGERVQTPDPGAPV